MTAAEAPLALALSGALTTVTVAERRDEILRKVCTPKPCIMRSERGMARSLIAHISMCVVSGIREAKSQNVSWALAACG